jgi:hypothetical protein
MGVVDILQPDIAHVGGISALWKVSAAAKTSGVRMAPHACEGPWRCAQGLAEDIRYYGDWMSTEAEKRIGHLYPQIEVTKQLAKDRPDWMPYVCRKFTVIAWLWARTVKSPNPALAGVQVPLVASFWLSTKKGKRSLDRAGVRFEALHQLGGRAGRQLYNL